MSLTYAPATPAPAPAPSVDGLELRPAAAPAGTDQLAARESIPKHRPEDERRQRRGVDPDVWLDHVRYARRRDPGALERLVAEYDAYARSLANRLHRGIEGREDLHQVALEALLLALQRFDPDRGIPFPAFATPTILGSLRRHYRDRGWLVRVPRSVQEIATDERTVTDRLTMELGRVPTTAEVAGAIGVTVDQLLEAQDAAHSRNLDSLDHSTVEGDPLSEIVGQLDESVETADERLDLWAAIRALDERSQALLLGYYVDGRTQTDLAEEHGVSQMQVSRLLEALRRQLRRTLEAA